MKKTTILTIIANLLLLIFLVVPALGATSDTVTITATPSFIGISNSPGSYDFGNIAVSVADNTSNGYFTITNDSTVAIDIFIQCDGWSGTTSWTYGAPAADTGQLAASSANGGTGGSGGVGQFDVTVLSGTDTLLCDGVASATNPTWELQLQTPTSYTHGDQQTTTITLTATAD